MRRGARTKCWAGRPALRTVHPRSAHEIVLFQDKTGCWGLSAQCFDRKEDKTERWASEGSLGLVRRGFGASALTRREATTQDRPRWTECRAGRSAPQTVHPRSAREIVLFQDKTGCWGLSAQCLDRKEDKTERWASEGSLGLVRRGFGASALTRREATTQDRQSFSPVSFGGFGVMAVRSRPPLGGRHV